MPDFSGMNLQGPLHGAGLGVSALLVILALLDLLSPNRTVRRPYFVLLFAAAVLAIEILWTTRTLVDPLPLYWALATTFVAYRLLYQPRSVGEAGTGGLGDPARSATDGPLSATESSRPAARPRRYLSHAELALGLLVVGSLAICVFYSTGEPERFESTPVGRVVHYVAFVLCPLWAFIRYRWDPVRGVRFPLRSLRNLVVTILSLGLSSALVVAIGSPNAEFLAIWAPFWAALLLVEHNHLLLWKIETEENLAGQLDFLANHDPQTGLRNRLSFHRHLEAVIRETRSREGALGAAVHCVMMLDLDNLRHVNDSLGNEMGNYIITEAARRIQQAVGKAGNVFRIGGDEFAVVLADQQTEFDAAMAAEQVLSHFAEPFVLDGTSMYAGVSIGLSLYPRDGRTVVDLNAKADAALFQAKEDKNTYRFYAESPDSLNVSRIQLVNWLRQAIDRKEMYIQYQPQFSKDGRIEAAEALLRWRHPLLGDIAPKDFIPVAEESSLILPIGAWVIEQVCEFLGELHKAGHQVVLAVNLSARQVRDVRLVRHTISNLRKYHLRPEFLNLEITEHSLMDNTEILHAKLRDLAELGFRFSIDDFGIGYSSLGYLKRLPIHEIKIDRTFVMNLPGDAQDAAVVEAIIRMASGLGLRVVAEGVDNDAQIDFLSRLGCSAFQGYYLGRPADKEDFLALLETSKSPTT